MTLKLLSLLLTMMGYYQNELSQTRADAGNKVVEEDLQNDPAYIEWCIVNDKHPDCNPSEPRNPRHSTINLGHWD
ncbi:MULTISPECIES: hypothetical protein [unclassified Bartonella]|uniref:hypothetical protein n=1 Tax=unclassified Bartonella TaxID=2645622 RepID=UPI0020C411C9|nr:MULTISPECIES: hypothetical protein [unclassified Bartonella]